MIADFSSIKEMFETLRLDILGDVTGLLDEMVEVGGQLDAAGWKFVRTEEDK